MDKRIICLWLCGVGILIHLYCCKDSSKEGIPVIDLKGNKAKIEMQWDDLGKNLRIIPLETQTEVLLPSDFNYWIGNKYLIIGMFDSLVQFDIQGKYVRTVARCGKGPGEFLYISAFTVDEKNDRLYYVDMGNNSAIKVYDLLAGKTSESISFKYVQASSLYLTEDGALNGFTFGDVQSPYQFYSITPEGVIKDTVRRKFKGNGKLQFYSMINPSFFTVLQEGIHFCPYLSDTLFLLKDSKIQPVCTWSAERRLRPDENVQEGMGGGVIFENEHYLVLRKFNWRLTTPLSVETGRFQLSYSRGELKEYVVDKVNLEVKELDGFNLDGLKWKFGTWPKIERCGDKLCMLMGAIQFKEGIAKQLDQLPLEIKNIYNQLNENSNPVLIVATEL